jgi:ABC-type polysaccharide/polyol phosphate export permease
MLQKLLASLSTGQKRYLNLLGEIAISQFKMKDQSSFFGFIWSFLHPLIILIVLYVFFNGGIGKHVEHYAIYLLIGIIHFQHFSNTTGASMTSLYSMRQLTANTVIPKEILVIGVVISNSVEFIISMFICVFIAYWAGVPFSWTVVLLPLVVLLQVVMVLWVSFFLSCLYVFVRDIAYIYQVFLRILFFITPTFYTPAFLGAGPARYIVLLNPLAYLIGFSRSLIIEGEMFSSGLFLLFSAANLVMVFVGFRVFKRYEPRFAEHI